MTPNLHPTNSHFWAQLKIVFASLSATCGAVLAAGTFGASTVVAQPLDMQSRFECETGWFGDASVVFDQLDGLDADLSRSTAIEVCGASINSQKFGTESTWNQLRADIVALMPSELRQRVTDLALYEDSDQGHAAYINYIGVRDEEFILGFDIDYFDQRKPLGGWDFIELVTHEFAHIIALHASQMDYDPLLLESWFHSGGRSNSNYANEWVSARACDSIYSYGGCAKSGSVIGLWYKLFWRDQYSRRVATYDNWDEKQVGDFYADHRSDFVTEYAATNPIEDMAETFMVASMPQSERFFGPLVQKKLSFLRQHPETAAALEGLRETVGQVYYNRRQL